ncbi:MAG: potassium/proton antiporter [Actinomycetota bacterium]|nr:potassium/proton antiporter [Actinomycetota bacterium]MDH4015882.1 potassium/proton antiporter [Actinomycetota bacterium]
MGTVEVAVLVAGILLLAGVFAARASERLRVPALLLFLGVGMLAGSEGPGGIAFDSPEVAQAVGTVCLVVILFSGGLDTQWATIRPVLAPGLVLATAGVILTALVLGTAAWLLLGTYTTFELGEGGLSWPEALLLGVIVSSTDAAALFALFKGAGPMPTARIRSVLELESSTNDPVAVILTTVLLGVLTASAGGVGAAALDILVQILVGAVAGVGVGWVGAALVDRLGGAAAGLHPILALAVGFVAFGLTDLIGGNGFLAVYLAGLVLGNRISANRQLVLEVTDAFAWLAQIVMFLVLGLLVFPSELAGVAPVAVALAFVLMFLARPGAVFVCLAPFRFGARPMAYVSWAGLKGAVPIVLATFPATYGLGAAREVFSVVFVIVVVSVLVQGLTLESASRRMGVLEPADQ